MNSCICATCARHIGGVKLFSIGREFYSEPSNIRIRLASRAAALRTAAGEGRPCPPVRSLIGETDVVTGHAVEEQITERRMREGARLVGRKIGLTAPVVQAQLGGLSPTTACSSMTWTSPMTARFRTVA